MSSTQSLLFRFDSFGGGHCFACAHRCRISATCGGICGQRRLVRGSLQVPWEEVAGLAVDPMEKKPLFHFYPGEVILSFGTLGCNLRCQFCQNWQSSQVGKDPMAVATARSCPTERLIELAIEHQCVAVASTYNEPLVSAEWTAEVLRQAQQAGLRGCLVTNGFGTPEAWELLLPVTDAVNIDLKCFRNEGYQWLGGKIQPVLDAIKLWHQKGKWVEVTTLVVPGFNDSQEELRQIADFIASVDQNIPWHVSAYHTTYKMPSEPRMTDPDSLRLALEQAKLAGLRYAYTGNLSGKDRHEDTLCPNCGQVVLARHRFTLQNNSLKNGHCQHCQTKVAGVFPHT